MGQATYIHLAPEADLPSLGHTSPARVVVIVEADVTPNWQSEVSHWLMKFGCLYMLAWGKGCSTWDDSVDLANIEEFKFEEIPESKFVMTTWHQSEPLSEVFWFAKNNAFHPSVELERTVLLHISSRPREPELLQAYAEA
jgi:hypothetical protein